MINVCITGHRPNKLYGYNMNNPKYDCLRKVIYNVIEKLYYKYNNMNKVIEVYERNIGGYIEPLVYLNKK